ncbi:MAG: hypothetical protein WDO15_00235 [Bacteroidota bacterium]
MLRILFAIIICFTCSCSLAQSRIYFNTGIGTYLMDDMKTFQAETASSLPVRLKKVKSFPPYVNYEAGFDVKLGSRFFVGASGSYGSSGCRSDYQDYSGSERLDQLWKYKSIALSGGIIQKFMNEKLLLRYELRSGVIFNHGTLDYRSTLGTQTSTQHNDVHSRNIYAQPTVTATRRFGPIGIDVYVGLNYNFSLGKVYDDSDPSGPYFGFFNGTPIGVDWTGLRAGLGVSFLFGK